MNRYGIKRIKKVVDEDGTVVIRMCILDLNNNLSVQMVLWVLMDICWLLKQPIKPGNANTEELAKVKEYFKYNLHLQVPTVLMGLKLVLISKKQGRIHTI